MITIILSFLILLILIYTICLFIIYKLIIYNEFFKYLIECTDTILEKGTKEEYIKANNFVTNLHKMKVFYIFWKSVYLENCFSEEEIDLLTKYNKQ